MPPHQKTLDKQNELQEKSKLEICYIHKMAFVSREVEEPIPFGGMIKFIDYVCPMCESIREYTTE